MWPFRKRTTINSSHIESRMDHIELQMQKFKNQLQELDNVIDSIQRDDKRHADVPDIVSSISSQYRQVMVQVEQMKKLVEPICNLVYSFKLLAQLGESNDPQTTQR